MLLILFQMRLREMAQDGVPMEVGIDIGCWKIFFLPDAEPTEKQCTSIIAWLWM